MNRKKKRERKSLRIFHAKIVLKIISKKRIVRIDRIRLKINIGNFRKIKKIKY